ncbi:unnamed protein product [Cochlearia groenlandica]
MFIMEDTKYIKRERGEYSCWSSNDSISKESDRIVRWSIASACTAAWSPSANGSFLQRLSIDSQSTLDRYSNDSSTTLQRLSIDSRPIPLADTYPQHSPSSLA